MCWSYVKLTYPCRETKGGLGLYKQDEGETGASGQISKCKLESTPFTFSTLANQREP